VQQEMQLFAIRTGVVTRVETWHDEDGEAKAWQYEDEDTKARNWR
jgi:hypothetical protein